MRLLFRLVLLLSFLFSRPPPPPFRRFHINQTAVPPPHRHTLLRCSTILLCCCAKRRTEIFAKTRSPDELINRRCFSLVHNWCARTDAAAAAETVNADLICRRRKLISQLSRNTCCVEKGVSGVVVVVVVGSRRNRSQNGLPDSPRRGDPEQFDLFFSAVSSLVGLRPRRDNQRTIPKVFARDTTTYVRANNSVS